MGRMFKGSVAMLGAMVALAAASTANAQSNSDKVPYPVDTVTLITHSSPGGGTDIFLREMTKRLGEHMDANFIVENVRGGSGAKAMAKIATSPADGSVLYGTTPTFINTSLLSKPQHSYEDLQPVANIFLDPQVVFVRAQSPYQSLSDVVDAGKANPNSVKFGVTTPGSLDRQVMEKFKSVTGVEGPVITHDGGGDLLLNVLNGTVDLGIGEIQELTGQLEAGDIRLLATYTEERLDDFPDVPTAREEGVDLVVEKFRGLAGPKGLSEEVLNAWEQAIPRLLEDPEFREWYRPSALVPAFMPHEEYEQFIAEFAEDQKQFFVQYGITEE
jgi:putative tricarboxylic transport membrane protein